MLALGLLLLVLAIRIWSPWLGTISWVLFVAAWMKSQNQSQSYWGLMHFGRPCSC